MSASGSPSFTERLARALRDAGTAEALDGLRASETPGAPTDWIDAEGFRVAALLIARLRFERLVQGDREVARRFEEDPAGFAGEFKRYHGQVPMTAESPAGEARLFRDWQQA